MGLHGEIVRFFLLSSPLIGPNHVSLLEKTEKESRLANNWSQLFLPRYRDLCDAAWGFFARVFFSQTPRAISPARLPFLSMVGNLQFGMGLASSLFVRLPGVFHLGNSRGSRCRWRKKETRKNLAATCVAHFGKLYGSKA